jgi:hypothetical protein
MVKANPHSNGNGSTSLARTTSQSPPVLSIDPSAGELMKPPPWLEALRSAMSDSIKADDVAAVMKKQVEMAKDGDLRAASFVMNQAHKLMTTQAKQQPAVTIVQNNYFDSPRPDEPIEPGDDKNGNVERKLRARARAGEPITGRPEDRRVRAISDEEEKELRRRQQERETDEAGDPLRD